MLHFYKLPEERSAAEILRKRLVQELSTKQRVLWLVSGGSNIAIEAAAMQAIPAELQPYLAILPVDERYGPPGHQNSNLYQLQTAGFVPGKATLIPVLAGLPFDETIDRYNAATEMAFANADVVIAQLGIGADGHIAGLLPGSAALKVPRLVAGYEGRDFMRLTLTPTALKKANIAYAFAFGDAKREQVERLQAEDVAIETQPAQILKQIPEAYVYNDVIGDQI